MPGEKGFAAEGAKAVIDDGMNILALPRITAVIHQENKPSIRNTERLGIEMKKEVKTTGYPFLSICARKDIDNTNNLLYRIGSICMDAL